MNLHKSRNEFEEVIIVVSNYMGIPFDAIRRDYYIVMLLQNLQNSEYAEKCVFKGGTSLSKCYPGSINRFSEDIDLTFIPTTGINDKTYDKELKNVESSIVSGFIMEKIINERNNRNKSSYVWYKDENRDTSKIKIEIGSNIRPDPFSKKKLKSYIQEYLEEKEMVDDIKRFELEEVEINVLDISRTFLDKVMAVKRHALCGTLLNKVRHIYDVTSLLYRDDVQEFLSDRISLKQLLVKTKETDSFYLEKRNIPKEYNPKSPYAFEKWEQCFNDDIRKRYESLHKDLLYTSKQQDFNKALHAFKTISDLFASINE